MVKGRSRGNHRPVAGVTHRVTPAIHAAAGVATHSDVDAGRGSRDVRPVIHTQRQGQRAPIVSWRVQGRKQRSVKAVTTGKRPRSDGEKLGSHRPPTRRSAPYEEVPVYGLGSRVPFSPAEAKEYCSRYTYVANPLPGSRVAAASSSTAVPVPVVPSKLDRLGSRVPSSGSKVSIPGRARKGRGASSGVIADNPTASRVLLPSKVFGTGVVRVPCPHLHLYLESEPDGCHWVHCLHCHKEGPCKNTRTLALIAWAVHLTNGHPRGDGRGGVRGTRDRQRLPAPQPGNMPAGARRG